ncbi:MAG: VOC family protein [Crocinitomicaceae bacterium]|nr:VOC family protein [Crocinitomicaceae bacterium]
MNPFHLAIPVKNLSVARTFYKEILECSEGRTSKEWVDFDFFGHQLVLHENPDLSISNRSSSNEVDGHNVPIPHFGVVLDWEDWIKLSERLKAKQINFIIAPYIRFEGKIGEQATMFFLDPENNALEFKAFKNIDQLFAK